MQQDQQQEDQIEDLERAAVQRAARALMREASGLPGGSRVAADLQRAAEAALRMLPANPPSQQPRFLSVASCGACLFALGLSGTPSPFHYLHLTALLPF